jgi:hypothetical protein
MHACMLILTVSLPAGALSNRESTKSFPIMTRAVNHSADSATARTAAPFCMHACTHACRSLSSL